MKTKYLNTDLDLVSSSPMNDLIACFEEKCNVLYYEQGKEKNWYATVESEVEGEWIESDVKGEMEQPNQIPENNIQLMLNVIQSLFGDSKKQWEQCEKRELNIGYDFGDTRCFQQFLSAELVKQIADARCLLGITLYNMPEEEKNE